MKTLKVSRADWVTPQAMALGVWLLMITACGRPATSLPKIDLPRSVAVEDLSYLQSTAVGNPITNPPWIAHVLTVDLDRDGRTDIVFCEARENKIVWLRQTAPGTFEEHVLMTDIPAPVHVEAADMTGSGHWDLLVASMGEVFPNNDTIGSVIILENDGHQNFSKRVIAEHIARVTDVRAADLDGDGKLDLAVAQFGYDQGEVRWMRNLGNWQFESHILLNLSGTINVCIGDLTGNYHQDIVAVVSQQWEEIYLFENDGHGEFTRKEIWGSTNEDYGSSGISLCDLNRDGRLDILYTNGDGFGPAALPGPRPWHGVQWLENRGQGYFRYHRIGDLPGAYGPVGVDLDGDGLMDVVAVAAYAGRDRSDPQEVSLMWFRNDGNMAFTPHVLAHAPKNLLTLAAGAMDGNGRPALVTGGFYVYPPYEQMGRITLWRRPVVP